MKKHILIASIVAALGIVPMAAVAQDKAPEAGSSGQMKGPPNANGAQQGRSDSGGSSETNSKAPAADGNNGAASAKETGASGDKKM